MSDNALTTSKAALNFFDDLDSVIAAVRSGAVNVDAAASDPRSIGIQNALKTLEKMNNHFNNSQAQIGARSKSLTYAEEKASMLEVNIKQLKSSQTEVDEAETYMKLNQVSLNYQAILQSISKVNSLSLLNYMK